MATPVIRTYGLAESDGTSANIYLSPDLGDSWFLAATVNETAVFDLKCDPDFGGSAVLAAADGMYYTRDGGYTWTKSVGPYTATGGNFKQIAYVDSDIVLAIGDNHIIRSVDGGIYFIDVAATADLYGPAALGYSIYFADQYKGIVGVEDKVYVTADGGNSWTVGNANVAIFSGEPVYSVAMNSDFLTINVATINRVYRSTDFATTFGLPTFVASFVFSNRQKLLRYSDTNYYLLSNNNGEILISINGGSTWTSQSTIAGAYGSNNIIDLHFYTATTGLILPDATSVRKTTDSGITTNSIIVDGGAKMIAVAAAEYTCGNCPPGYTTNPEFPNKCIKLTNSPFLCNTGCYNPAQGTCTETSGSCLSDIIFIMDNSRSVSDEAFPEQAQEMLQQKSLLTTTANILNNNGLLDSLTGLQIGLVDFTTYYPTGAVLDFGLTDNINTIVNGINNVIDYNSGGTTTKDAFRVAINELVTNGRPGVPGTIVLVTDGPPNEARQAYTYNGLSYPWTLSNDGNDQSLYPPEIRSLCDSLKTDGYTVILVVLGTNNERNLVKASIGSTSTDPIYSTVDGVDYQYEAEFENAPSLAEALSNILCISSTPVSCPTGWNLVTNSQDPECINAYCSQTIIEPLIKCCFLLEDCQGILPDIYTETDLTEIAADNLIIKIEDIEFFPDVSNTCWEVTDLSGDGTFCNQNQILPVTVSSSFANCAICIPRYKFTNCQDCEVFLYSTQDFEILANTNQVVTLDEYPNTCWVVSRTYDYPYVSELVTVNTTYNNCADCLPDYYELINCNNDDISIVVNDPDFAQHVGKVVEIFGYPGLCWSVNEMSCDCINVIVRHPSSGDFTFTLNSSGTFNGKNVYYLSILGNDYGIGWNNELNRWELFDVITAEAASYSTRQSNCPFDGAWVAGTLQVISIQPCIEDIYDVSIVKVYPNCPCCLTNNCI